MKFYNVIKEWEMRTSRGLRAAALTFGAMLVVSAGAAIAAEEQYGEEGVEIDVTIDALDELAMTVADDAVTLTEDGSTGDVRQFTGELPAVTVTDARDVSQIDPEMAWAVLGTASDFTGDAGQDPIDAGHLGWTPTIVDDGGSSGLVFEGPVVDTVLDDPPNNVGLVDQELLFTTIDSEFVNPDGQWTASADLYLRVEPTVAAGHYTSTMTLSLFEAPY